MINQTNDLTTLIVPARSPYVLGWEQHDTVDGRNPANQLIGR